MVNQEQESDQSWLKNVDPYAKLAAQILASVAASIGLLYAIGFAVVNISLLSYGVFEVDLVRTRYISTGVSYIVLFAILIGLARLWLALIDRFLDSQSWVNILIAVLPVAVISYILALLVWGLKGIANFSRPFLIWCIGISLLMLLVAGGERVVWIADHLIYRPEKWTQLSSESKPKVFVAWSIVGLFLLVFLFFYGQFAYATFPPAFGGGLPIVVQFSGEEDTMTNLKQLGIHMEDPALTSKVELIGQTSTKYIILVKDEALGEDLAVAFDKSFVQGIRFYPERFYLSPEYDADKRTRDGDAYLEQGNLDRAIYEYEEALRRFPDYAPALLGRAAAFRESGDFGKAIEDYKNVIKLDSEIAEAYYGLARAHALDQAQAAAIENLKIAIQKDETYLERAKTEVDFRELINNDEFVQLIFQGPENAMFWYAGEGDDQREAGNFGAAEYACQQGLTLAERAGDNRDQASFHNRLGELYRQEDDLGTARDHFQAAVNLEPANAKYHFDLGTLNAAQNLFQSALNEYNQALEIDSGYVAALVGKGKVLVAQEVPDHEAAEDSFSAAILLEPNNSEAYFGRAIVRAYLGRVPEASADLCRAIALNTDLISRAESEPAFKDIQAAISPLLSAAENFKDGNQLAAEGKYEEAIPKYLAALELDPSNLVYRARLGEMYYQLGRLGDAEKHYVIVVSGEPENDSYQFILGRIYEDQGQPNPAIDKYKAAISINDQNAQYHARLAAVYYRQGDLNNALAFYNRAIELDKNNPSYVYNRALVYKASGDLDRAIQDFEAAIQFNPEYGDAYCELGLAYQEVNQPQKAESNLTQCLQLSEREELRAKATQALGALGLP